MGHRIALKLSAASIRVIRKIALIIPISILLVSLVGCDVDVNKPIGVGESTGNTRFEIIYYNDGCNIITDKKTGKEYLFVKNGYAGGLTELD